jgi:hypothetical protein
MSQIPAIAPYLLQHLKVLAGANDPSIKITPSGFLKLAVDHTPSIGIADHERLRLNNGLGQLRDISLWTYSRSSPAMVTEERDCSTGGEAIRKEFTLSAPYYAQRSFTLGDNYLERYAEDAVQTVQAGTAPTPLMSELMLAILAEANAIVGKMDQRLLAAATFGKNVTNNASSKNVNIQKDALTYDLTDGISSLIADAQTNELYGTLLIAGSGLMHLYEMRRHLSTTMDSNADGYLWYHDIYAKAVWGDNAIGVFAPGTIGLIDVNRMLGFRQRNYGTYQSFQLPIPIETTAGVATTLMFDIELRFQDCPTEIADRCGYGTYTIPAGWSVTISKTYGLYQLPTTIYDCGDRLTDTNGALKYVVTNNATS